MGKKARRYLLLLAAVLVAVVFIGYQFIMEIQKKQALDAEKAAGLAEWDTWDADNTAKQNELTQVDDPEWIRRQGHEIGLVGPDEIKIVDKNK